MLTFVSISLGPHRQVQPLRLRHHRAVHAKESHGEAQQEDCDHEM